MWKFFRYVNDFFTFGSIFWIFCSESMLYLFFRDWSSYIRRLSTNLSRVNILYVKMFQAIASNNSLIDEKTNNELLKFTDNAPWCYDDINFYDLIELENEYDLYFKDGYEKPINSGMISVVFKAYQRVDDLPVVIKIKKRNIAYKLDVAIENLKSLMYFLSFIPIIHKYQIAEVVNKNIEIIREQTNFRKEVENILKVKKNCENLKYVKIPEVYPKVTEEHPNCIIMEFIDGLKMSELKEEDFVGFSKQVLKFGLVSTIVHGVSHGDFHSGNILFIKDENDEKYPHKIGVIDFGIIFEIDNTYKETLFELFTQVFERPPRETITQLLNSVIIAEPEIINKIPHAEYDKIITIGAELFTSAINDTKNVNQIQLYRFMATIKEYLNKKELSNLGIRPSDNYVKSQLVMAMAHGVTLTLCKDKFVTLMDQVLNELFHTNILLDEDEDEDVDVVDEDVDVLDEDVDVVEYVDAVVLDEDVDVIDE